METTGWFTALHELRMVDAHLRRDKTMTATFSVFARPAAAYPWYVALGTHRLLEALSGMRIEPSEVAQLRQFGLSERTLTWLEAFRPSGDIWAVPDGTIVLAHEPIAEVTAPLPVAHLLSGMATTLLQRSTAVATTAARHALVARYRRLDHAPHRRAESSEADVDVAVAAFVGGGFMTSNIAAALRWGIPATGVLTPAYVQAFADEQDALRALTTDHPDAAVLPVDTSDLFDGMRRAIAVAEELHTRGQRLRGVHLDSGDLGDRARQARKLLDDAGLEDVEIVASGDLDEYRIDELVSEQVPIDVFNVDMALDAPHDHAPPDIVCALVEYDDRPVATSHTTKRTYPNRKQIFRPDRGPAKDVLSVRDANEAGRWLLEPVWRDGQPLRGFDPVEAHEHARTELARLPPTWRLPPYPDEPPLPRVGADLEWLTEQAGHTTLA